MAIVRITMKSPDCLDDAASGLCDEEAEQFKDIAGKWFKYSEYLTVEIDTEKKTCIVVPNKKG